MSCRASVAGVNMVSTSVVTVGGMSRASFDVKGGMSALSSAPSWELRASMNAFSQMNSNKVCTYDHNQSSIMGSNVCKTTVLVLGETIIIN